MLAGIVAGLRARCGEEIDIVVHSIDPDATTELHGVPSVHRYRAETIRSLRGADLVISGGGSLLQDVTSARSIIYYLSMIRIAQLLGRKTMIYAQGIGPIRGKLNRRLTRNILNNVKAITVRDEESRKTLWDLGVRRPKIEVTADPSFAVEPASEDVASAALAAAGAEKGMDLLGVSLRPWAEQVRWLPDLASGIRDAAVQLELQPVFLPMQPALDRDISLSAAETVRMRSAIVRESNSPAVAKAITAKLGMIVSMRLHALIFAASMGVPGVAICYDPKVREFARAVGMTSLDVQTLTSKDVRAAIVDCWERRQELGELAGRRAAEMRKLSLKSADIACELLSGKM